MHQLFPIYFEVIKLFKWDLDHKSGFLFSILIMSKQPVKVILYKKRFVLRYFPDAAVSCMCQLWGLSCYLMNIQHLSLVL